jgi:hypothetical protein
MQIDLEFEIQDTPKGTKIVIPKQTRYVYDETGRRTFRFKAKADTWVGQLPGEKGPMKENR